MENDGEKERCGGVTRAGTLCTRRAVRDGRCAQHTPAPFYARALSVEERADYAEALAQEGLSGEVALLRLHLLRLIGRADPAKPAEIVRTVLALVRALKEERPAQAAALAALDEAIREEGERLLGG